MSADAADAAYNDVKKKTLNKNDWKNKIINFYFYHILYCLQQHEEYVRGSTWQLKKDNI